MLPRTLTGWAILIVIILLLLYGPAGAASVLHGWLTGAVTFFGGLGGR